LRLPSAQLVDGGIVVLGAFDAVYWTDDVANYETALHALLPSSTGKLELWASGTVSPRASRELSARGWEVHDHAAEALAESAKGT
jgi:hypothetical protein